MKPVWRGYASRLAAIRRGGCAAQAVVSRKGAKQPRERACIFAPSRLCATSRTAFTLVELVVVIAIIVVLATIAVVVGKKFLDQAKGRDTAAMMNVVKTALDQFASERPLKNIVAAYKRYGDYPPDELQAFTPIMPPPGGIPVPTGSGSWLPVSLTIGAGNLSASVLGSLAKVEHRDVKTMMLTIRLYSTAANSILDKIGDRFVSTRLVASEPPQQYYDSDGVANPAGAPNPEDIPLTYLIDAWGNAVEYYSLNPKADPPGSTPSPLDSGPAGVTRRAFSTLFVTRNNSQPFLVSYGIDGSDQLAATPQPITLLSDWNMGMPNNAIDKPENNDNIYSEPDLKDKLRQP